MKKSNDMKNVGKKFEESFKKSIPSYCMVYRLKDTAQSYNKSVGTKFTWDNPCDFFIYDTKSHYLYSIECKSTKNKYMTFQKDKNETSRKMIQYHQIKSLKELSAFDGIKSGFVFNFRDEKNNMERTYFQDIQHFLKMCNAINKSSFNEMDLILNNAIKINGHKKRVNYVWDMEEFFMSQMEV